MGDLSVMPRVTTLLLRSTHLLHPGRARPAAHRSLDSHGTASGLRKDATRLPPLGFYLIWRKIIPFSLRDTFLNETGQGRFSTIWRGGGQTCWSPRSFVETAMGSSCPSLGWHRAAPVKVTSEAGLLVGKTRSGNCLRECGG